LQNTYTFKVTVVPTPNYYWNILAGSSAGTAGTTNATGTSASFSAPSGFVKDSNGNYFVADTTNNLIRKITPQGVVTTFAGFGGVGAFLDGAGTAAKFNSPQGLAIDSSNNLYVADFGNNRIRKIDTAGNVTTIAGTGVASSHDCAARSATMSGPTGIAVDSTGTVYWADKATSIIRKLQGGQVTTIAGSSGLTGTTNGTGSIARFNLPTFLTLNNAGNLVVNDATNLSYRQVTPAGVVTTLFSYTSGPTAVGVDAQGNIYAGLSSNTLSLISSFDTTTIMGTGTAGSAIAVNTAATVGSTRQMVFLSDGTIVIADNTRNNIRVGAPIPSLMNPGKQIVLADQLLTFDNAALEGLGIQSNGYPEPLSITLTVTKGVLMNIKCVYHLIMIGCKMVEP
jgi:sugar lactone lactonase YvrE